MEILHKVARSPLPSAIPASAAVAAALAAAAAAMKEDGGDDDGGEGDDDGDDGCDNTLSPPHPVGRRESQTVSPGSPVGEYPPRKKAPKSTHARLRPGEGAPSGKHELCDRKSTCPRPRPGGNTHASPSYSVRCPRTARKPSSDTLKGPSETLLRHPQMTLGKPFLDTLTRLSENPPFRAHGASLSEGRPKL